MKNNVLAVMQPYIFPYIGYFNLINSATHFVFYDDVDYIKQGWINRNRILINGHPSYFSIPLSNGRSGVQIREVKVFNLSHFYKKFKRTLEQSYGKSPFFDIGLSYVEKVLLSGEENISKLAELSISEASNMLEIEASVYRSSSDFSDSKGIGRSERLISIAQQLNCKTYVNSINASFLYDKQYFSMRGVNLSFIKPKLVGYNQLNATKFIPGLSIIDLIMNLSLDEIKSQLDSYELV
jgi:hypothetical protein